MHLNSGKQNYTYFFKLSTVLLLFCVVEGSENNSKILIQLSSCPRQGNFENMTVIRVQKHLEERNLVNANKLVFAHVAAM